jgi:hypothetical protein
VPSWSQDITIAERRALSYWTDRSQSELAAYTYAAASFWTRLLPQMFQSNKTIRHSMVAVATLHEDTRSLQLASRMASGNEFYMKNYFTAVRDLTSTDPPPSREVILVSCLLFMACENLRESAPGVMLHLRAGLKVLREWHRDEKRQDLGTTKVQSDANILFDALEPIFARLEAGLSLVALPAGDAPDFGAYDLHWKMPTLPRSFANLFEARAGMHDVIQWMWFSSKSLEGHLKPTHPLYHDFLRNMDLWLEVYRRSFPKFEDPQWKYYKASLAMLLHHRGLRLAFCAEASQDPYFMDKHDADVTAILDDAELILLEERPKADLSDYGFSNIWAHDFSIEPPLLIVCVFCHNLALRRRAIHLIRTHHCWWSPADTNYDACSTGRLCELIAEIEEGRLPGTHPKSKNNTVSLDQSSESRNVPLHNRIRATNGIINRPGKLAIEYVRLVDLPIYTGEPLPESLPVAEVDWPYWAPPPIPSLKLYPFTEMVKYGVSLGLLRPLRRSCNCRSLGGAGSEMWKEPA